VTAGISRSTPVIEVVGPEAAGVVQQVVRAAFADRPPLDPPTDALAETEESIAARLAAGAGLVARVDGQPAGAVLLDAEPDGRAVHLRRFGLTPAARGRGVATALMRAGLYAAAELGDGKAERAVVFAREELPHTMRFWRQQGFAEFDRHPPYVELARALPRRYVVPTADDMLALAGRVAGLLRAGDVLVLSGDLGAGKTTFTQGLGAALQVRGDVTSPTFVISRVHPSLVDGPDLIHVDAYRLGGAAELDDLDLDTDLDRAITVVEWGEGLAEDLADSPLEIRILRTVGDPSATAEDSDSRTIEIDPLGRRWLGVELPESPF
jgi:tRNA threonylcarbamoyladenosine biosynthesis protein TsaE